MRKFDLLIYKRMLPTMAATWSCQSHLLLNPVMQQASEFKAPRDFELKRIENVPRVGGY